ncbi:LysR family transcriptional regulator [Kineosporia corallincola]|uniref:LysR family transcriptional regulator n=1 Tax=Kineosporia corallincola TaxID=2835133 RepID=UPI0027DEC5AF|nr:LysR family transcriptional regulator [Kineosporia corallincola]
MQELDLLDAFMRVYQRGSMTAAAAELGVSQPALTDRITRLEARLGVRLFERSRRGTRPTGEAERLAARVGEPLGRLREVMRPSGVRVLSGELRLGGPAEIVSLRVLPALAPLLGAGLRLDIRLGQAHELLADLASGANPLPDKDSGWDEGQRSGGRPGPGGCVRAGGRLESPLDLVISAIRPKLTGVTAVPLVDEEFLLIGTAAHARSIDPAELATEPVKALAHLPLVAYSGDLPIVRRYWLTLFGHRPPNRVALTVPDLRAVLAAVTAGTGISVLPRYIARPALEAASVQVLHRGEELPLNTVHLAWRTGEDDAQPLGLVREHLLRAARDWGTL